VTVCVVGYASLDFSASIREFRGVDATSILQRGISWNSPGIGGIAHIAHAVRATGTATAAISWVGDDENGRRWTSSLRGQETLTDAVAVSGTRSPNSTLIEIGTGGTICLFDPGDCHPASVTSEQRAALASADWVVLTVAPRHLAHEIIDALPDDVRLAWAVKHDDDAYTSEMVVRILERADIVSFSAGERAYITVDGLEPERRVRPGTLVVETRGAAGVRWAFGSGEGPHRAGSVSVERIAVDDTTGAGDTFVGTLAGLAAGTPSLSGLSDADVARIVTSAATASGELLRRRTTSGRTATAPSKETL
jgi:ribokinase